MKLTAWAAGLALGLSAATAFAQDVPDLGGREVVVVTENGYENFTAFLPSELNDLENAVKQGGGIAQRFPPGAPKGVK